MLQSVFIPAIRSEAHICRVANYCPVYIEIAFYIPLFTTGRLGLISHNKLRSKTQRRFLEGKVTLMEGLLFIHLSTKHTEMFTWKGEYLFCM